MHPVAARPGALILEASELLNIGEEDTKGNEVVKRAAGLLRTSGLNFYGNVEGNDIFKGTTKVVVCDGFVDLLLQEKEEKKCSVICYQCLDVRCRF